MSGGLFGSDAPVKQPYFSPGFPTPNKRGMKLVTGLYKSYPASLPAVFAFDDISSSPYQMLFTANKVKSSYNLSVDSEGRAPVLEDLCFRTNRHSH